MMRLVRSSNCVGVKTSAGATGPERFLVDAEVSALIRAGDEPGAQAVARALAYRYFKRIVAHLMNLLSGVVMPLDRLDFFGLDPEDRDP